MFVSRGVVGIIEPDGEELGAAGHGRAEAPATADGGKPLRPQPREPGQAAGRELGGSEIGDDRREVAQDAGFIDEAGLFLSEAAVADKFHVGVKRCGVWCVSRRDWFTGEGTMD